MSLTLIEAEQLPSKVQKIQRDNFIKSFYDQAIVFAMCNTYLYVRCVNQQRNAYHAKIHICVQPHRLSSCKSNILLCLFNIFFLQFDCPTNLFNYSSLHVYSSLSKEWQCQHFMQQDIICIVHLTSCKLHVLIFAQKKINVM